VLIKIDTAQYRMFLTEKQYSGEKKYFYIQFILQVLHYLICLLGKEGVSLQRN
jgi:hypothetical protein